MVEIDLHREFVRRSVLVLEQRVSFLVIGELFGLGIPFEKGFLLERDIAEQGCSGRSMTVFNGAVQWLIRKDGRNKVTCMPMQIGVAVTLDASGLHLA